MLIMVAMLVWVLTVFVAPAMHTPVIPGSVSTDLTVPQDSRCAFLQVHSFDDGVLAEFLLKEQSGFL